MVDDDIEVVVVIESIENGHWECLFEDLKPADTELPEGWEPL